MRILGALLCVVLVAVPNPGTGTSSAEGKAEEAELSPAVQALKAREERVKSLRCTWTATKLVPKGSLPVEEVPGRPMPSEFPTEDQSLEEIYRLLIDGHKFRRDYKGWGWYSEETKFIPWEGSAAFVDGVGREILGGIGMVTPDFNGLCSVYLCPMIDAYRLLDPVLGSARPDELRLAGTDVVGQHPCVVVEKRDEVGTPGLLYHWWLAKDMDYAVVQWQYMTGDGRLATQASDMVYEKDEQAGWRLRSWTLVNHIMVNRPPETTKCLVTDIRSNEPVEEGAFDIVFPPGTRVGDHFTMTDYTVGERPEAPQKPAPPEGPARAQKKPTAEAKPAAPAAPPVGAPLPQAVAPPRRATVALWLAVGGSALVLLIIVAVVLSRRRAAG